MRTLLVVASILMSFTAFGATEAPPAGQLKLSLKPAPVDIIDIETQDQKDLAEVEAKMQKADREAIAARGQADHFRALGMTAQSEFFRALANVYEMQKQELFAKHAEIEGSALSKEW